MLLQAAVDTPGVADILSTLTASTLTVSIIQWLKAKTWIPFINQHSAGMNRTLGWLSAFATGTGIHWTFNHDAGVLTITGLSLGIIIHSATVTMKQYAFQLLIYKGIFKGPADTVAAVAGGMPVTPVASAGAVAAGVEKAKEDQGQGGK